MERLALATVSFCTRDNKEENLAKAFQLIRDAKSQGADWVLLPEIFAFNGSYKQLFDVAEVEGGAIFNALSLLAKELNICLFAGTMGERPKSDLGDSIALNSKGNKRVYNTMYVFDRMGNLAGKYRKTHLFNLKTEKAEESYCEPEGFIPGDSLEVIELEGWRVGLSICYDLRFPELFSALGKEKPLDMIVLPAAFTYQTGKFHWELLLRARAVENQCFVFSSNQCGEHREGRQSFGHSLIIDPWGEVIGDTGDREGIALAEVTLAKIKDVRNRLPALNNRRPELY